MALTTLAIKSLKPKDKLYLKADGGGLTLAVSPAGGKLWRWRYRFNGTSQVLALGKWPEVSLEEARKLRDEARALLKTGKHPTREKKAQRQRRVVAGANTFEAVARAWFEIKRKSLNAHYADQTVARLEQHAFPYLGALPITEIDSPDVVRALEQVAAKGTIETAHKVKRLISQTFRYAIQRGLCRYNPAADLRDILPSVPDNHYPCIPPAELPELLHKMDGYKGDALTIAAMHLLALTFVRTGELIGARWEEIQFDRAEWHIPKERMKMKRPHVVPLSRQAMAILESLKPLTGDKEHIFHSQRGKAKHISNGAVLMALRRMGYQGRMTGHGFRTLASTILNEKGYQPDWIERQLAHEDGDKIRSAYNRAEYLLERKKMMQDYADILDGMRESAGQNVVGMKKRGKA